MRRGASSAAATRRLPLLPGAISLLDRSLALLLRALALGGLGGTALLPLPLPPLPTRFRSGLSLHGLSRGNCGSRRRLCPGLCLLRRLGCRLRRVGLRWLGASPTLCLPLLTLDLTSAPGRFLGRLALGVLLLALGSDALPPLVSGPLALLAPTTRRRRLGGRTGRLLRGTRWRS
ncbi:MAG: hypothetical protein E6G49_06855 [Actinobacteria bacterium]|nr:MAG: hypothetical protein E6G49_06855 [Actinomycetota bacterium]